MMIITKSDVLKLMKNTVNNNWLNPDMSYVDNYERAITLMSMEDYEGKEKDIDKIMEHIHEYDDFKIENIYSIIYNHLDSGWNFKNKIEIN